MTQYLSYFSDMDRKQKMMRLIIESLTEQDGIIYEYTGAVSVLDPNLISMDFVVRDALVRGELNVRGLIDMPLSLQAQYDNRSLLNDHPEVKRQITVDLEIVSEKINRVM